MKTAMMLFLLGLLCGCERVNPQYIEPNKPIHDPCETHTDCQIDVGYSYEYAGCVFRQQDGVNKCFFARYAPDFNVPNDPPFVRWTNQDGTIICYVPGFDSNPGTELKGYLSYTDANNNIVCDLGVLLE